MEDTRLSLWHEPEAYPPFDEWYHSSPSGLIRLRYLMNREERENQFSRHSRWWVRVGDEPYPPLPYQQEDHASQSLSLSLPLHNIIMQVPIAKGQHQDRPCLLVKAPKKRPKMSSWLWQHLEWRRHPPLYWPWSGYESGKLGLNLDWTLSPGSGSGIILDWTWITVRVHRLAGPGLQVPNQVHRGGGAERRLKNHTGKFTCSCTKMSVMR